MISLYVPGSGPLHRLPAMAKMLGLAILSLALAFAPLDWMTAAAGLALTAITLILMWLPPRQTLLDLARTLPFVVFIGATVWLFQDALAAAAASARLLAIFTLAIALTRTTRVSDVMESWPLRRFERFAMAVSLVMTMIPALTRIGAQVRDAQRSRRLRPSLTRWVMPFLVLSLRHADDVDDALRARR